MHQHLSLVIAWRKKFQNGCLPFCHGYQGKDRRRGWKFNSEEHNRLRLTFSKGKMSIFTDKMLQFYWLVVGKN